MPAGCDRRIQNQRGLMYVFADAYVGAWITVQERT
jgi:hypothetical protein